MFFERTRQTTAGVDLIECRLICSADVLLRNSLTRACVRCYVFLLEIPHYMYK